MRSRIILKDIRIYGYHGVLPEETMVGTDFLVTVTMVVDLQKASETDELKDTVNYALVNDIIHQEMKTPSKLLEHVAGRIIKTLAKQFPQATEIQVEISKINPPMQGEIGCVSVELQEHFE